jgi:ketosteroid isomerase-like protein
MSGNLATLSTFLDGLSKRETMRQALEFVAEDFEATEPASLPYGGTYRGRDGLLDMLRTVNKWVRLDIKDTRLREAGDRIVAQIEVDVVSRASGAVCPTRVVELYTVSDGSIRKLEIFYLDTVAVANLLGPDTSSRAC